MFNYQESMQRDLRNLQMEIEWYSLQAKNIEENPDVEIITNFQSVDEKALRKALDEFKAKKNPDLLDLMKIADNYSGLDANKKMETKISGQAALKIFQILSEEKTKQMRALKEIEKKMHA